MLAQLLSTATHPAPTHVSHRVGFDNPTSLRLKSCYARYRGLGGVMVWDGEMDDDELLIRGVKEQYDNPQCDDFEPPAC